jgi:HAD superfamily hydrolase (TIGR01484 family)
VIQLLALDIDGTLLRRNGSIAELDRAAIGRAQSAGITVVLATGRIHSGARPIARDLGLDTPVICASGSCTVDSRTGDTIESFPLEEAELSWLLDTLPAELTPYLLTRERVHHDGRGEAFRRYVSVWSEEMEQHSTLEPRVLDRPPLVFLAIGPEDVVDARAAAIRAWAVPGRKVVTFPALSPGATGQRVVLVRQARGKGAAIASVAHRLGCDTRHTAAVGDWINDIAMFGSVGRSFAMGQAIDVVAEAATERLVATDMEGGGVAEAISRILD